MISSKRHGQNNFEKYLTFIVIVLVHTHATNALGLMIGAAVPSVAVGQIASSLIIVVMLLFGGTLLNVDSVSPAIGWQVFRGYFLLPGCKLTN